MGIANAAPNSSGDLPRRISKLERDLRGIQNAKRLESAAVGTGGVRVHSGGSVRLQGGGSLIVEDDGSVIVDGDIEILDGVAVVRDTEGRIRAGMARGPEGGRLFTNHANGTPHLMVGDITSGDTGEEVGQGVLLQQSNGRDLVNIFANPETGRQQVRAFDDSENVQFRTDKNGTGLDRPYTDVPMWPVNSFGTAQWPGTDWQSIWLGRLYATHPALHVQARTWTTDDTTPTTGQVRVLVGGSQLGSIVSVGNSTTIVDFGSDTLVHGLAHYVFAPIEIQSRVTAGNGYISVMPYGVTKKGTV